MQKRNPSPIVNSVQDIFKDLKKVPENIANFNRWFTALNGTEKFIVVIGTMVVVYGGIYVGIKYDEYLLGKEIEKCEPLLIYDGVPLASKSSEKSIAKAKYNSCVFDIKYNWNR